MENYLLADARNVLTADHGKRKRVLTHVRWEAPPHGWIKLNIDKASKGNPDSAGARGILRNAAGGFVKAFTFKCGYCTSVRAEMFAVLRGLLMARNVQISSLVLEVDSEVVLNSLREEPESFNLNYYLILQCKDLLFSP